MESNYTSDNAGKDCFFSLGLMIHVSVSEKATVKGRAWILPYKLFLKCKCLSIKCISVANINMPGNNNNNKKASKYLLS